MESTFGINTIVVSFGLNLVAMAILIYGMFYPRHRDRQLATTAAIFNAATFAVLGALVAVEFSLAAGFGLFAILALWPAI